jgi:hypothetical protein
MVRGSCLCGAIRYELDDPGIVINHCHCSMCRKASGTAFGTFLHIPLAHFRWVSGEDTVKVFEKTPNNPRAFCPACGSRVPSIEAADDHVIVPAGGLDDDPGLRPAVHIFVGSKAPWYTLSDDLPKFDEAAPSEFFAPHYEAFARRRS